MLTHIFVLCRSALIVCFRGNAHMQCGLVDAAVSWLQHALRIPSPGAETLLFPRHVLVTLRELRNRVCIS